MNDKTQMMALLKEEFHNWEALLTNLDEAQIIAQQLPDKQSIKDVMAHLMTWQQLSIARLEAALHDREPIHPDWPKDIDPEPDGQPHEMNAWIYETHREQPWSTVYRAWHNGFLHFLELGEAIPETDLVAIGKYPWLEDYPLMAVLQGSYEHHHHDHFKPLSTWLKETRG